MKLLSESRSKTKFKLLLIIHKIDKIARLESQISALTVRPQRCKVLMKKIFVSECFIFEKFLSESWSNNKILIHSLKSKESNGKNRRFQKKIHKQIQNFMKFLSERRSDNKFEK